MQLCSLLEKLSVVFYHQVTHRWYGEIQGYDFSDTSLNSETLNFTQLVWHDSREVGVGKVVGKDGFSIVVAQYSPPGNREGVIRENVQKLHRSGLCFCLSSSIVKVELLFSGLIVAWLYYF